MFRVISLVLLFIGLCFDGSKAQFCSMGLPDGGNAIVTCPLVPAYYVATAANGGSDSNLGTLASPFLTLQKAQTAMRSGLKTTYIRAGIYTLATITNCDGTKSCGLQLLTADNGETWSYYPPDGVDTASFSGGSTNDSSGLWEAIFSTGITNLTINGLVIHDFIFAGLASSGGDVSPTYINNVIYNQYKLSGGTTNPGGIFCYGCSNAVIANNVIHDTASMGIDFGNVNGDISGMTVRSNVLYNTCTGDSDCGAIYMTDPLQTATNITWTNNYIRDGNSAGSGGYGSALYVDNCASNVTATGNIIAGHNGSNTTQVHGGKNVHFNGNIIDLAAFGNSTVAYQGYACPDTAMSSDRFEKNIVISSASGGGYHDLAGTTGPPIITNNVYYDYGSGSISTGGSFSDSNPVAEDPQLSCWTYNIASGSPVYNSPVGFPWLARQWGPPGYTIPPVGTAPSNPHAC